jgi:hypothetical protein
MPDDSKTSLTFSQRMGIVPVRTALQVDSMDDALRNSLWNLLDERIWRWYAKKESTAATSVLRNLWADHFKHPLDSMSPNRYDVIKEIRAYFFSASWNSIYDLFESIAKDGNTAFIMGGFTDECNRILKREQSGYRFVGKIVCPIISESEIQTVETAMAYQDPFKQVSTHISTALKHLSDRNSPDYRNSIKESISAVEAACQIITGDPKATLGQAVKKLEESGVKLHPAFEGALQKIYGYTSDAEGIRHALLDESTLDSDDARFMLVSCSAFVNYLKAKSSKSGS